MTDISDGTDPAAAFAALMGAAAEQADTQAAEAPFGYTKDAETGEMRPKKSAGRPRKPPSLDELKAEREEAEPAAAEPKASDRAPEVLKRSRSRGKDRPAESVPAYKAGVITTGVNRLYRRAGKIVRAMDEDIGEAIIQAARNTADEGEPDDSVGAAWDELCKTNPRIRKFVMKCLAGGAWGQLVMAHAPIAMAVVMKPAIRNLFVAEQKPGEPAKEPGLAQRLITSMAEPDEDTGEGEGGLPGGMTAADAGDMARLAQEQIARMGFSVPPEVMAQMEQTAASMMNGGKVPVPAGQVRHQPRRASPRAKRH